MTLLTGPVYSLPFVAVSAMQCSSCCNFPFSLFFLPFFIRDISFPFLLPSLSCFWPFPLSFLYPLSFLGSFWLPSASYPSPLWLCLALQEEIFSLLPQPSKAICNPLSPQAPTHCVAGTKRANLSITHPLSLVAVAVPKQIFPSFSLAATSKKEAATFSEAFSPGCLKGCLSLFALPK